MGVETSGMFPELEYFSPTGGQILGLLALLVWCAAFYALGRLAAGGRSMPAAAMIYGWAITAAVFTFTGTLTAIPFTYLAFGVLFLAVVAAVLVYRRDGTFALGDIGRALALGLPFIVIITGTVPAQWDEFTNWLPNVLYLIEHDAFPRDGAPKSHSIYPAYPYGLPLVIYLASRVSGLYVENAGALFNLLLHFCLGLMLARLVYAATRATPSSDPASGRPWDNGTSMGWVYCAIGLLATTALSPAFVPKIVFTSYADSGTSMTLGAAAILGWFVVCALGEGDDKGARRAAWQFGLAAAALISLKQVNLVLLAALVAGMGLAALRDPGVRLWPFCRLVAAALILPVAIYLTWRIYVSVNLPSGEFEFLPVDKWNVPLAPDILQHMLHRASKKGGYFGIMAVAVIMAVWALRRARGRMGSLTIIAACVFLLYNGFLFFTYIAAFSEYDALRTASFWRYNTHLGGVSMAFAAYGAALLWKNWLKGRGARQIAWTAVAGALLLPIVLSPMVRFDTRPTKRYVRAVGEDLATRLSPEARLVVLDPTDNGYFGVLLHYATKFKVRVVDRVSVFHRPTAAKMRSAVEKSRASHVWVHIPSPDIDRALGVSLTPGASYLLARSSDGWSVDRSWPYPGYRHPHEVPD